MASYFAAARDILKQAIAVRAFPAATIEVGNSHQPLWREAFGRLTFDPESSPTRNDTVFDLASLTKVLSTTTLVMRQVERGILSLDDPIVDHVAGWRDQGPIVVTIRDLLSHAAGLAAHVPYYLDHDGRDAFETAIQRTPRAYEPRSKSVYSDLGFMLLGFILDRIAPLATQFDTLRVHMGNIQDLQFVPPAIWKPRTAPTRIDPWRERLLVGEVDDDNAWALGGIAGHAGLFGVAGSVGEFARHMLQVLEGRTGAFTRETAQTFVARRTEIPDSSRALGWDTMLPTSSCGTRMSPRAFGHVGFTGTSLWIDPERSLYVTLLTNRVHPTPDNNAIARVRPALHDAIVDEL
ncbi:MAG TPA: serine hydrolase domain-containing protein [Vicinamibacterales bacterium]